MSAWLMFNSVNILLQIPMFFWMMEKGRKETIDGGEEILVPLLYGLNSTFKSYSKYDVLDTTPLNPLLGACKTWLYAGTAQWERVGAS